MENMNSFTEENKDDLHEAIACLDRFTKNFCMNVEETNKGYDWVFRCSECEFKKEDEMCMVHVFAYNRAKSAGYDMDVFGSMGSL